MANDAGTLNSVTSALKLLIFLSSKDDEVALTDIAEHFGIGKSTTHRLLSTLRSLGFVEQDLENSKYRIGLRAFEVGNTYLSQLELPRVAAPVMEELVKRCNEKTNLAVLDKLNGELVYVKYVDPQKAIRIHTQLGRRSFLHATALGKVILAQMDWADALALLSKRGLQPLTAKTIVDPDELCRDLEKVRELGYALDDEENYDEVRCVAAPIWEHTGQVTAALSISGHTMHVTPERVPALGQIVKEAAREISVRLGYRDSGR